MNYNILLLPVLFTAAILVLVFTIMCVKRIFLEKQFAVLYIVLWLVLSVIQVKTAILPSNVYWMITTFISIFVIMMFVVALMLKRYLKLAFSSLIQITYKACCIKPIIIQKNYIGSQICNGYVVFDSSIEKLFFYTSIDEIVLKPHFKIISKLNKYSEST